MRRFHLLVPIFVALLAALTVVPAKGRSYLGKDACPAVQTLDPLDSPTALRWRQGQHSHWRACMLQH